MCYLDALRAGVVAAKAGKRMLARIQIEQATEIDSRCPDAWIWMAWLADSTAQASEYVEIALARSPDHSVATRFLALLEELNQFDSEAGTFVTRAMDVAADMTGTELLAEYDGLSEDDGADREFEIHFRSQQAISEATVDHVEDSTEDELDGELTDSVGGISPIADEDSRNDFTADGIADEFVEIETDDDDAYAYDMDDTAEAYAATEEDEATAWDSYEPLAESSLPTIEDAEAELAGRSDENKRALPDDDADPDAQSVLLDVAEIEWSEVAQLIDAEVVGAIEGEAVDTTDELELIELDEVLDAVEVAKDVEEATIVEQQVLAEASDLQRFAASAVESPPTVSQQPVAEAQRDEAAIDSPVYATPAASTANRTILAVDDSPTVLKLVQMTLEAAGYEVVTAPNGIDAMKLLATMTPAMVLLDVNMPRMDGYKLCKLLKSHDKTRLIPVVMLSGKDGLFDKLRGKLVGCDNYISKPFESVDLLHNVARYVPLPTNSTAG